MAEKLYVVHENHLGEKRYQPALLDEDGDQERLVISYWLEERQWRYNAGEDEPILLRSRWQAKRLARREMRRRARGERKTFKEVSDD